MAQLTEDQEQFARDYGEVTKRTMGLEDFLEKWGIDIEGLNMMLDEMPILLKYTEDLDPEDLEWDEMTPEQQQIEIDKVNAEVDEDWEEGDQASFDAEYNTGEYTDMSEDDKGDWGYEGLDSEGALDRQMQDSINFNEGDEEGDWNPVMSEEDIANMDEWEGGGAESGLTPVDSMIGEGVVKLAEKGNELGIPPWFTGAMILAATKGKRKVKTKDGMFTPKISKDGKAFKTSQSAKVVGSPTTKVDDVVQSAREKAFLRRRFKDPKKGTKLTTTGSATTVPARLKTQKQIDDKWRRVGLSTNAKRAILGTAGTTALLLNGNRDEKTGDFLPKTPEVPIIDKSGKGIKVEKKKEERPGWHKQEGTNFWNVNQKSPYWKTEEGGLEAEKEWGSRPSWVKQKEPREEIDWSVFGF